MKACISRRAILGAIPALLAQGSTPPKKTKPIPRVGEFTRLIDPATESILVRLTALSSASELPRASNRLVSARDRFLLFSSNRGGMFAPYRLDLRTGVLEKLADTQNLHVRSLTMDRAERSAFFLDSGQVKEVSMGSRRTRVLAEGVREFVVGSSAEQMLVLRGNSVETIKGQKIAGGAESLLLLDQAGKKCVFTRSGSNANCQLWMADTETGQTKLLVEGDARCPFWSPDEEAVLFLKTVENGTQIVQVQTQTLQTDTLSGRAPIACFAPNANASVFASAMRSIAQPFLMLMLRTPRREITLCEHHSTDPAAVNPVFSPNSDRIYFQTNREGKSAIYSIDVSKLVEPTPIEGM